MTVSTATFTTPTTPSKKPPITSTTGSMQLSLSSPRDNEYKALALILRDSFDISGKAIWQDSSPQDLLHFRTSVIQHRDSLRKLSESGQIKTQHRMLVARDIITNQSIGFAIWSIDDYTCEETKAKNEKEETRLSIPQDDPPTGTRKELWDEVFEAFVHVKSTHMKERSNCYVKYLCVDNKVQRSGAGTALMKAIRKDAGTRPLYLEAADTPSATQFYQKLGFTILERLEIDQLRYTVMILEPTTDSILDYDAVSAVS